MKDIYTENNLYPYEGRIKDHFKELYDSVFIAFLPFFVVNKQTNSNTNFKKSEKITFQRVQEELELLRDIPEFDAAIYYYSSKDFPTDKEIYEKGKNIPWENVIKGAGLKDYAEVNKALRTSIGALRNAFRRHDLTNKINVYTTENKIWHPTEGSYDILSKVAIYNAFKILNKKEVIVKDEFYESTKELSLDKLSEFEFSETFDSKDYYVYSADKEILFTLEWDSFFFLIATTQDKMEIIIKENLFEGFIYNNETTHNWDYSAEELKRLLEIEKQKELEEQKAKSAQLRADNKWWKFWN
ncbi:MAG: hypothetical protein COW65_16185 [Cytophagales bacterium CG18_big_fil_WC_8_21_14_2_50_42_9]|nr:MAG: hypothetical protein COW65_16185 [Cytophagales bacterium CG18_big_fil_WC_8_21_14_2_50_42_9]